MNKQTKIYPIALVRRTIHHVRKWIRDFVIVRPMLYRTLSFIRRPGYWLYFVRDKQVDLQNPLMIVRAHHLFCLNKYNMLKLFHPPVQKALKRLKVQPELTIQVVAGPDDICNRCSYWDGSQCKRGKSIEEANIVRDKRYIEAMQLKEGDILEAHSLFEIMRTNVDTEAMKDICSGCSSLQCDRALRESTWWD